MLDGITLDQLRTFLAAVDAGSFSAAGRRLGRAQSVVSHTIATMEARIDVRLFDRTGRHPTPTAQAYALVAPARAVLKDMDAFKGQARSLAEGLEPEVAVTADVMVPLEVLAAAARAFEATFPTTALRMSIEPLGGVLQAVIDGVSVFAIAGPLARERPDLVTSPFPGIPMGAFAAPGHPLLSGSGPITREALSHHRQLVLSDRSDLSKGREFGVLSPSTWRLSDLGAKRALLRAGLGWGAMPRAQVASDLADGSLVEIAIAGVDPGWAVMAMHAVHRVAHPPGIAARWLLDRLRAEAARVGRCAHEPTEAG